MRIQENNFILKSTKICVLAGVAALLSFSTALAGDAVPLPEGDQYEGALLDDDANYPSVGLRKKSTQDCYCGGAYFSVSGGYAFGNAGTLSKGQAISNTTGELANVQPAIANPGIFNEYVPNFTMSGKQITASFAAGYKFPNFRVEASGEYRRHNTWSGTATSGGIGMTIAAKTQQYGMLMSAFYDVEVPNMPITPYVGLGAGLAMTKTKYNLDFTNAGTTTSGSVSYSKSASFMGAAMAGVALKITDGITFDVGYRLTNISGGQATYDGNENAANINLASGVNLINPTGMGLGTRTDGAGITDVYKETLDYPSFLSHEIKAGIRYSF